MFFAVLSAKAEPTRFEAIWQLVNWPGPCLGDLMWLAQAVPDRGLSVLKAAG